ncbi:hypothetical protein DYB25_009999 [Aphanomyces astaci]|uniref:PDZ domain-containing protein n=1 Tax=Aphanomyces astaci TaxID=112090 RepID=A0A397AJC3_APHAT|nr:hypothetical protein DYB25_009999 [Aphanomyces astaci]
MLQNIENRPVVKAFTDEVDWHTNPQLTQLLPRDELVAINETSVILLGFDAAIDRLRHVEKPATLQFRRVLVHDSTSQGVVPHASPSDESFLLSSPIWGYGNTSSSRTSLYTPPTSMVPILQQHSMPASDVDIDDARESLGKTELFPLSTTHNVFTMLRWSGEPLGIALQKHPTSGHLEIKLCTGGGLSASHGCLAVGDVLVSVAGVPMQTFGLSTCLDFLNATQKPVSMVFRRHGYDPTDVIRLRLILSLDRANPPPPRTEPPNSANNTLLTDDDDQAPQEYTVEWDVNMSTRLTLQPMFCKHNLVLIVLSVHASSMAQERVQVGDRLMAINGLVVNELPLDTVKAMLAVTAQLTFHHHISTWTV